MGLHNYRWFVLQTQSKKLQIIHTLAEKSNERLLLLGDAPFSIDGLKRLAGGWFQLCLPTPTAKVSFVCCGWSHMIIITDLGMAYACGDNYHSQCGIQTSSIVTTPTLIDALKDRFISSASCGDAHTLFVTGMPSTPNTSTIVCYCLFNSYQTKVWFMVVEITQMAKWEYLIRRLYDSPLNSSLCTIPKLHKLLVVHATHFF